MVLYRTSALAFFFFLNLDPFSDMMLGKSRD